MMQILTHLEPRFEKMGTTIIDELEEFNEVLFIDNGTIFIGYQINKKRTFCISNKNRSVIGAYGCTFNQQALFIYYAKTNVSGFSIRKGNWIKIIKDFPQITKNFKRCIMLDYMSKIKSKCLLHKKKNEEKYAKRQDQQNILVTVPKNKFLDTNICQEEFNYENKQ